MTQSKDTLAVSIDINKKLWKAFSNYVDKKYGPRNKTRKVEQLITKYMKKHAGGKKPKQKQKKKQIEHKTAESKPVESAE